MVVCFKSNSKARGKFFYSLARKGSLSQFVFMSSLMNAENLSVILVEPTHPGNIGATARAMANMGVRDLRLVRPKDHLNEEALQRAAHGLEVLEKARKFDNVEDSLHDLHWVAGTTARNRAKQDRTVILPEVVQNLPSQDCRMGFMFGRESSGLTNEELSLCSLLIHIPTHNLASSLNLSHAVLVTLYEVFRPSMIESTPVSDVPFSDNESDRASISAIAGLRQHLKSVLTQTGFIKTHQETGIMNRFDDFFARAEPTSNDVQMWRGVLHRVELTIGDHKPK